MVGRTWAVLGALVLGLACGGGGTDTPQPDVPGVDGPGTRPVVPDAGVPDAGAGDGGTPDAGTPPDAGMPSDGGTAQDAGASPAWERELRGHGGNTGVEVDLAPGGDVVVAATHGSRLPDFGGGRVPERGKDLGYATLSRFSPAGQHLWTYAQAHESNCGNGGPCTLTALNATAAAAGQRGEAALATRSYEEGRFSPYIVRTTPRVTLLEPDGRVRWRRELTGPGGEARVEGLGFDPAGNLLVAGSFEGPGWDFGDGLQRGEASRRYATAGFVASWAPDGTLRWVRVFGDARGDVYVRSVAVDAGGDVVLLGALRGRVSFGGEELVGAEEGRITGSPLPRPRSFMARLGPGGEQRWSRLLSSGQGGFAVRDLAVGPAGIALAGAFSDPITLAGRMLPQAQGDRDDLDGLVAVFGPDGTERWARALSSSGQDDTLGVGWTPDGDVWVAATTSGALTLGATQVEGRPERPRLALARLRGGDGEVVQASSPREVGGDSEGDLDVDARGVLAVTGSFAGGDTCSEGCGGRTELFLLQRVP